MKSLVWYVAGEFRGSRLRGSQDPGRADGARPTRSSPTAACRGASASVQAAPPAGRRPTGSRTSCCAPRRRKSTTSGPRTRSRSTIRRSSTPSTSSPRSPPTTKMVDGGAAAVAATDFRDSPKGLFAVPPKCYLHHQASFIPSFFPEGTKLGEDADFFYLPPYGVQAGTRQSGARRRHAGHDHQGLQGRARLHRIPEDAARA